MSNASATLDGRDATAAGQSSPALAALVAALQHVTIGMAVRAPDNRLIDVNPASSACLATSGMSFCPWKTRSSPP
jgi:hypothetical protein